ncbi:unnamed protein product [Cuscuta campestris]|uniref:40S ribosomal protein SA n=1 Tax=Cuscuta campestris TaxID=132261 RepID=A0A484KBE1_9ASTE|nr:unnamed protein product [Cuscuta campestris]
MLRYVYTETEEHCIVDLFRTWSKTLTAARVINAIPIEEHKDIFVLSARPFAQKAVKEFAKQIGATAIEGDNSIETFAAKLHSSSIKPRLLIVADSKTDRKAVAEAFYSNIRIPVIAFADVDASMRYVDIGIPGNLTNKRCIARLFWLLGKTVRRTRNQRWRVPVLSILVVVVKVLKAEN